MRPSRPVALLLIIRVRSGLLLILVWIIPSPRQNIGGGFPAIVPMWHYCLQRKHASLQCQHLL